MPYVKPSGHSNKRTKAFYEFSGSSKKQNSSKNGAEIRIVDAESCKSKRRLSKKPKII